jgi:hypothetical protein
MTEREVCLRRRRHLLLVVEVLTAEEHRTVLQQRGAMSAIVASSRSPASQLPEAPRR